MGYASKGSIINVSQVIILDKSFLTERTGKLGAEQRHLLNDGLRLVMEL
jgi:mRNA interferase MazF